MNHLELLEYARQLEFENSELRAQVLATVDNLHDAEAELVRYRVEIRNAEVEIGRLRTERRSYVSIPEDGPPPPTQIERRHLEWLEHKLRQRNDRIDNLQAAIARAGPGDGSKNDCVHVLHRRPNGWTAT